MKQKKIIFLTDLPEKTGSWENRYKPLVDMVVDENIVKILNPNSKGHSHNLLLLTLKSFINTLYYLWNIFFRKYDLIILFKPLPISSMCCLILKLFKKNKYIHLDYDDYEFENNFYFKNKVLNFIQKKIISFFERNIKNYADSVSTHNTFLKNKLINSGFDRGKIFYLPNFLYLSEKIKLNQETTNSSFFKICYFGEINDHTGHSLKLILDSYDLINIDKFKIFIYGEGPDLDKYKSITKLKKLNNVFFKGKLKKKHLFKELVKANLIVEPIDSSDTHKARFPIKMVESLFLNIPYLTAKIGIRKKILGDKFIYYKRDNSEDLARKINVIFKDYSKYKRLFYLARKRNNNLYNKEVVLTQFISKLERSMNMD